MLARRAVNIQCKRLLTGVAKSSLPQSFTEEIRNYLKEGWAQFEKSTGEVELSKLKKSVQKASEKFDKAVEAVSQCRTEVETAQKVHEDAHAQYTQILLRRDQWNGTSDPAAFVELTAKEVETRQLLAKSRDSLRNHEKEANICQRDYMNIMRQRYHEEQMWQEKWRMWATYGTWSLIVLNGFIFIGSQLFHQRREYLRLKAMEEMITSKLQSLQQGMNQLAASSEQKKEAITEREVEKREETTGKCPAPDEEADYSVQDQHTGGNSGNDLESSEACTIESTTNETPKLGSKIRRRLEALKSSEIGMKIQTLAKDVHGPSVILGAASSAGFIFMIMLIDRR